MCVLETIWETLKEIAQRKINVYLKVWWDEKYLRYLRKLFKYQHTYSMVEK